MDRPRCQKTVDTVQVYVMTVRAFDLGSPSLWADVEVRVFVLDQNDHAPKVLDGWGLDLTLLSPVPDPQVLGEHT